MSKVKGHNETNIKFIVQINVFHCPTNIAWFQTGPPRGGEGWGGSGEGIGSISPGPPNFFGAPMRLLLYFYLSELFLFLLFSIALSGLNE